jgi:hypothetical protein
MKSPRTILCAATLASLLVVQAHGAAFSSDTTDLWWNPQESGWGVNIIQQSNVLFATFFVYGADGKAHWYVAPDMEGVQNSGHGYSFSGTLYETSGPAFFQSFNPETVVRRPAGTAAFVYAPPNNATLTYTVDGVTVNKDVVRQTWRLADFSGSYHVTRNVDSSCGVTQAGASGYTWLVTQSGNSVSIESRQGAPLQCVYSGSLVQQGHLAIITGTANCSGLGANNQPFMLDQLQVTNHGFTGRISVNEVGCTLVGSIAGVNDVANGAS